MVRSPGFGSRTRDHALFKHAFALAPGNSFNQASCSKSPAHSSTGTRSHLLCSHCLAASGFMISFTPLLRFFSPFPHGTIPLSVISEYLALRGGPRRFIRDFTCPILLGNHSISKAFIFLQDFHLLWSRTQLVQNCSFDFFLCPTTGKYEIFL